MERVLGSIETAAERGASPVGSPGPVLPATRPGDGGGGRRQQLDSVSPDIHSPPGSILQLICREGLEYSLLISGYHFLFCI